MIEPGSFDEEDHESPPDLVYVPTQPLPEGAQSAELVVYDVEDSRVLLMFSNTDKLVAFCGEEQPWVSIPAEQVDALAEHAGADGLALDLDWNALVDELSEDDES